MSSLDMWEIPWKNFLFNKNVERMIDYETFLSTVHRIHKREFFKFASFLFYTVVVLPFKLEIMIVWLEVTNFWYPTVCGRSFLNILKQQIQHAAVNHVFISSSSSTHNRILIKSQKVLFKIEIIKIKYNSEILLHFV